MTDNDAYGFAMRYEAIGLRNFYLFILLCLAFAGWTLVSASVHETEAFADIRKVMAILFTACGIALILTTLHLLARMNAAAALAGELFHRDPAQAEAQDIRLFRPLSPMAALSGMVAAVIVVDYVILIYVVDGGLF